MKSVCVLALLLVTLAVPITSFSQAKKIPPLNHTLQLVRTTSRHDVLRLAYGGTLTVIGAPEGSITIEGWPRNEVDISAEIQLRADTEADLNLLATVNTFVLDEDTNHASVLTTGTHDKAFMRTVAKKFPKTLLGLPWKIDYRIRVPLLLDLEINAGRGPISIAGVEGNIRVSATESETNLQLSGGTLSATVAVGRINLTIPARSWRGLGAELRLAAGEITLAIPTGFGGDIDAEFLRSGKIESSFEGLAPRERGQTQQKIKARAGAGGSLFNLIVGDGIIYIKKQTVDSKQ